MAGAGDGKKICDNVSVYIAGGTWIACCRVAKWWIEYAWYGMQWDFHGRWQQLQTDGNENEQKCIVLFLRLLLGFMKSSFQKLLLAVAVLLGILALVFLIVMSVYIHKYNTLMNQQNGTETTPTTSESVKADPMTLEKSAKVSTPQWRLIETHIRLYSRYDIEVLHNLILSETIELPGFRSQRHLSLDDPPPPPSSRHH